MATNKEEVLKTLVVDFSNALNEENEDLLLGFLAFLDHRQLLDLDKISDEVIKISESFMGSGVAQPSHKQIKQFLKLGYGRVK